MFFTKDWLQFFADGTPADGGDGAATGVESGIPGPKLEDLGVPADKAEKFRQRKQKTAPKAVEPAPAEQGAMSWDDFMKIPENNERMQRTMSERVNRVSKEKTEYISKLSPALELLAKKYKLEPGEDGSYDPEAIANAVTNDDSYYQSKAWDLGVDVETAKRIEKLEAENKRNEEALQQQQRDQQLREHFMKMQQQANDVKDIMPTFNLEDAIQDPQFVRLTSPEIGMTVKQALWALHGDEIQAQAVNAVAQRAKLDAANAIRSGIRPRENGSTTAAVSTTPNLKSMSREDRRAYIMEKYRPPDR
jgi:hypothetical protein